MTTHDFDTYNDGLPHQEPPYHEQLLVMQEMEEAYESTLKRQGAIEALQNLTVTLSALILRDSVHGDYFFGLHDALAVVKSNLDVVKGGAA